MRSAKVAAIVVLALSAAVYTYQYGREVGQSYPNRTFSVDASADIDVVPDIATFSVSVVTEGGTDVPGIQKKNTEKMNAVNAFLGEQEIDKKDMKTTQYSLVPRYEYPRCDEKGICPKPFISGYSLTTTLSVKVRDTEKLGGILSGVVDRGANTVSDVSFVVDDDTAAKNTARAEAIAAAKVKAEAIAKSGGFRVGPIVAFYENSGDIPLTDLGGRGGVAEAKVMSSSVAPEIEPGTVEKTVRVTVTYEIR